MWRVCGNLQEFQRSSLYFRQGNSTRFVAAGSIKAQRRVLQMVGQTDREGFGHCSNTEACQVECPQQISVLHIARMNWEYNRALLSSS